ncbi:hypothetical protein AMTR_s00004p00260330 [Amborella trichopoda]|uniref:Amino acid transporter transmembrane domain-containing protein n=1 Tax=Amborella trichopoda TaxID=13333 RepID=W1NDL5_AMBTC|nr:hypothetical protein AMTR_s00004p00260330 [Amborella trichopoda]
MTDISISAMTHAGPIMEMQKARRTFQAMGDIAFAYSYAIVLIEIQDNLKSLPSKAKAMRKPTFISVVVATISYKLCWCMGYAAFSDQQFAHRLRLLQPTICL